MQITVKSTKVLKDGTGKYGDWEFVKLITNDDTEYTTLAEGASSLAANSIINVTDMDENDKGQKSFKKYEVVEASTAPALTSPSTSSQPEPMTPDKWDEKDRRKAASIEGQTAMNCWTELVVAKVKEADIPELLRDALRAKISGYMGATQPVAPPGAETKPEATAGKEPEKPVIEGSSITSTRDLSLLKTITDLQKAVHEDYGVQPAAALKILGSHKWADITDTPLECYIKIQASLLKDKLDSKDSEADFPPF